MRCLVWKFHAIKFLAILENMIFPLRMMALSRVRASDSRRLQRPLKISQIRFSLTRAFPTMAETGSVIGKQGLNNKLKPTCVFRSHNKINWLDVVQIRLTRFGAVVNHSKSCSSWFEKGGWRASRNRLFELTPTASDWFELVSSRKKLFRQQQKWFGLGRIGWAKI